MSFKLTATVIESLTTADIEYSFKGVRVHKAFIDGNKKDRSEKFFRREYITILNLVNGKKIVRRVYGHNRTYDDLYKREHNNASFPKAAIALHYDDRDELGIRDLREPVEVVLYRTTLLEKMADFWNSDELAMRIANRTTIVAFLISFKDLKDTVVEVMSLFQ
mgnify:FL=1